MRYEELVENVREATRQVKVSRSMGHLAFQFNVEGEAEGAFYLEIADGRVNVEPYEYYDRDVVIVTTADVIMQMTNGGLQPMEAYAKGMLRIYGAVDPLKALPLGGNIKNKHE